MLSWLVLTFAGGAAAQLGPQPGTYDMEWAILHMPVSSDLPDLITGTSTVQLQAVSGSLCPPTSAFAVTNAPATPTEGTGTTTWCIKSVPNGTHTIKATIQDATGATATASISVLVSN